MVVMGAFAGFSTRRLLISGALLFDQNASAVSIAKELIIHPTLSSLVIRAEVSPLLGRRRAFFSMVVATYASRQGTFATVSVPGPTSSCYLFDTPTLNYGPTAHGHRAVFLRARRSQIILSEPLLWPSGGHCDWCGAWWRNTWRGRRALGSLLYRHKNQGSERTTQEQRAGADA